MLDCALPVRVLHQSVDHLMQNAVATDCHKRIVGVKIKLAGDLGGVARPLGGDGVGVNACAAEHGLDLLAPYARCLLAAAKGVDDHQHPSRLERLCDAASRLRGMGDVMK